MATPHITTYASYRPPGTKVETKRKLEQFTVYGWLIMNGGESGNEQKMENFKVEITFNMKCQYNYQPLFA